MPGIKSGSLQSAGGGSNCAGDQPGSSGGGTKGWPRTSNAWARATSTSSAIKSIVMRVVERPGWMSWRTVSGATGTGLISSTLRRDNCQSGSDKAASARCAKRAPGAPPCCACGSHGPRARMLGCHTLSSWTNTAAGKVGASGDELWANTVPCRRKSTSSPAEGGGRH